MHETARMASGPNRPDVIEVFADVWCPFAHVGLRVIRRTLDELGHDDLPLRVRAWPLELVNGGPMDPEGTRHHVADLRAQVAPDMFRELADHPFPTTAIPALALVERAYRSSDEIGERASFAVRDALFERGLDISAPGVVEQLATELGIGAPDDTDRDAVVASWHDGQRRGVKGSPHVFCGGRSSFCPSLDISRQDGHLSIAADPSALVAFLRENLAAGDAPS